MRDLIQLCESLEVNFRDSVRGMNSGQMDHTLTATVGGEYVGHVDYVTYKDEVSVQMIDVAVKRKGYGTLLIKALQRKFPDKEIDLGLLTPDGAEFFKQLPTDVTDSGHGSAFERLAAVRAKLADYEAAGVMQPDWNDLHDEEWNLEQELRDKKPTKRIFRT